MKYDLPPGFEIVPGAGAGGSSGPSVPDGWEIMGPTERQPIDESPMPPPRPPEFGGPQPEEAQGPQEQQGPQLPPGWEMAQPVPDSLQNAPLPPPRPPEFGAAAQPAPDAEPQQPLTGANVPLPPPRPPGVLTQGLQELEQPGLSLESPGPPRTGGTLLDPLYEGDPNKGMLTPEEGLKRYGEQKQAAEGALSQAQAELAEAKRQEANAPPMNPLEQSSKSFLDRLGVKDQTPAEAAQARVDKAREELVAVNKAGPPTMGAQRKLEETLTHTVLEGARKIGTSYLTMVVGATEAGSAFQDWLLGNSRVVEVDTAAGKQKVTLPSTGEQARQQLETLQKAGKEEVDKLAHVPENQQDATYKAIEAAAGVIPFAVGGIGAKALGLSPRLVTAILGAAHGSESMYEDAAAHGAETWKKWAAFVGGGGIGAAAAQPLASVLSRIDEASGGGLGRVMASAAMQFGEQGLIGAVTAIATNALAKGLYDPSRPLSQDVAQNFLVAGFTGAVIHAVGSGYKAASDLAGSFKERAAQAAAEKMGAAQRVWEDMARRTRAMDEGNRWQDAEVSGPRKQLPPPAAPPEAAAPAAEPPPKGPEAPSGAGAAAEPPKTTPIPKAAPPETKPGELTPGEKKLLEQAGFDQDMLDDMSKAEIKQHLDEARGVYGEPVEPKPAEEAPKGAEKEKPASEAPKPQSDAQGLRDQLSAIDRKYMEEYRQEHERTGGKISREWLEDFSRRGAEESGPIRAELSKLEGKPEAPTTQSEKSTSGEKPAAVGPKPTGFTTAKGSTYELHEDGTTTRTKSPHPEHPGDVGVKPRSELTVFVRPQDAQRLAPPQGKWAAIPRADGSGIDIATPNQRHRTGWGIPDSSKGIKTFSEPDVGLQPVELWGKQELAKHIDNGTPIHGYGKMHVGNPIVGLHGLTEEPPKADEEPEKAKAPPTTKPAPKEEPSVAEPSEAPPAPKPEKKPSRTQIGVNADGHPVFEDANGVRSVKQGNVVTTEPVEIGPKGEVQGPKGERLPKYETVGTKEEPQGQKIPTPEHKPPALNVPAEPTPAQAEAGNYQKKHIEVMGQPVSIETAKGQMRRSKPGHEPAWEVKMPVDYGYIKGTKGRDGAHIDAFIGPNHDAKKAYVIEQKNLETGKLDEHKVMLGFDNVLEARRQYAASFSDGKGPERILGVLPMGPRELKSWLDIETMRNNKTAPTPPPEIRPEPAAEEPSPTVTKAEPKAQTLAQAFEEHFGSGKGFQTIIQARKFAHDHNGETNPKTIEEAIEAALVNHARDLVKLHEFQPTRIFDALLDLYNRQPRLGARTSTSTRDQAYSTPLPLAWVANALARVNRSTTTVFEPTAGNGALLIGTDPDRGVANEINGKRRAVLAEQGFKTLDIDASGPRLPDMAKAKETRGQPFDVILANPPFGPLEGKTWQLDDIQKGYVAREIDHVIALRALQAMKDGGRAVLIIGGPAKTATDREGAYNGKSKREFFHTLYNHWNVVDHFTVAGELYAKQGAEWPVDVITIDGVGKSARPLPSISAPPVLSSWDELKAKISEAPDLAAKPVEQRPAPVVPTPPPGPMGGRGGGSGAPSQRGGLSEQQPEQEQPEAVLPGGDRGQPAPPATPEPAPEVSEKPQPLGKQPERADRGPAPERRPPRVEQETEQQVSYKPRSKAGEPLGTLTPTNIRRPQEQALETVAKTRGDVDAFVADELGYDVATIGDYLGSEQIDALALAIDNFKKGTGFIIGDQTGIGKGRVNAGVIRWAMKNGITPIFLTEKPNLYVDMYRDLVDIGVVEWLGRQPNILMTNNGPPVKLDEEGEKKIKGGSLAKKEAQLIEAAKDPNLAGHDVVFTTYTQLDTVDGDSTFRRTFMDQVIGRSLLILDESHNAGGSGTEKRVSKKKGPVPPDRSKYMRRLVEEARAVFYSSATYAKRPDNMTLYSRTDMRKAVKDIKQLEAAIARGGVPMQQVVAGMLSEAGQYLRRERSFAGIRYDTKTSPVDDVMYTKFSESLQRIMEFSAHVKKIVSGISDDLRDTAGAAGGDNATGEAGASSTNFTAVMHNVINQMLLSVKAKGVADEAIASIKAGEKPVIALSNTMEAMIDDYAEQTNLKPGDAIEANFGNVLERYLERSRWYVEKKPYGEASERVRLTDEELGIEGMAAWNKALEVIRGADFSDMPISPIDAIKGHIEKAGYKVGEITGRNLTVNYKGKFPKLELRTKAEMTPNGRRQINADFNGGKLDALILNAAGSTGISLHASEKFADQKPRHMIIAQAQADISTHMQTLGRINRTGQVNLPRFTQFAADVPAEMRPAAVLSKKMASLNANTTGSRSNSLAAADMPDFMNQYGDQVADQVMKDDPELNQALGAPVATHSPKVMPGTMRNVTGKIPLLPPEKQHELYATLIGAYNDLIEQLDAQGANALEAKTVDLDAKPVEVRTVAEAKGPSPFETSVSLGVYDVKRQGKPYTVAEMLSQLAGYLKQPEPAPADNARAQEQRLYDLARVGSALIQAAAQTRAQQYREYTKAILAKIDDPDVLAAQQHAMAVKGQEAIEHLKILAPGQRVSLTFGDDFRMTGVVLRVQEPPASQKNPLARGGWKVMFAVPAQERTLTIPLSRLEYGEDAPKRPNSVAFSDYVEEAASTINTFNMLATSSNRERRVIATGNLLSAFSGPAKHGRIINFTDHEGNISSGILMPPKVKTLGEAMARVTREITTADDLIKALPNAPAGQIGTSDGAIVLTLKRDGYVNISVEANKKVGGKYYQDRALQKLTYSGEFEKRGSTFRASFNPNYWPIAARTLIDLGAKFEVPLRESELPPAQTGGVQARAARADVSIDSQELPSGHNQTTINIPVNNKQKQTLHLSYVTPEYVPEVSHIIQEIEMIVRKVTGNLGISTYTPHRIDITGGKSIEQSGGKKGDTRALGVYWRKLLAVAVSEPDYAETAYHEAFHALQDAGVLTAKEVKLMEKERRQLENLIMQSMPASNWTRAQLRQMPMTEIEAYAFQIFAVSGGTAGLGQHVGVRRAFQKLFEIMMRVRNLVSLRGYQNYQDVFGAAVSGEMAARPVTPEGMEARNVRFAASAPPGSAPPVSPPGAPPASPPPTRGRRGRAPNRLQMSRWDIFRTMIEDFHIPKARLQELMEREQGSVMADLHDFYTRARLYPGREAAGMKAFKKEYLKPVFDELRRLGVSPDEAGEHLYALHARERNARIADINPAMPTAGSGMTDLEADAILARNRAGPKRQAFDVLEAGAEAIRNRILDIEVAAGLKSEAQADAQRDMYEHYAPLTGFEDNEEEEELTGISSPGQGRVASIYGPEQKMALGRRSRADNPLLNFMLQAQRAIRRAELNRVAQSMYLSMKQFSRDELKDMGIRLDVGEKERVFNKRTGQVESRRDRSFRFAPNVITAKFGGRERYMIFDNPALAEALRKMSPDQITNALARGAKKVGDSLKYLWTHINPEFFIRHFIFRYPIEGALNALEEKRALRTAMAGIPFVGTATRAILAVENGHGGGEYGTFYREMVRQGGKMDFAHGIGATEHVRGDLKAELDAVKRGVFRTPWEKAKAIARLYDKLTNALDNSLRLAAYVQARKNGKTPQQAALAAREATVDFQRRGAKVHQLQFMFLMGNTAIQTGSRLVRALGRDIAGMRGGGGGMGGGPGGRGGVGGSGGRRFPRLLAAFGAMIGLGVIAAFWNYLVGGEDEDKTKYWDLIPEWEKELNLILLNPWDKDAKGRPLPMKMPMPYNWANPMVLGYGIGDIANGKKDLHSTFAMVMKSTLEVLTPFAREANKAFLLMPEITRPIGHLAFNEGWTGRPIHAAAKDTKGPASEAAWASTGEDWQKAARFVNRLTGGSPGESGLIDVYPETMRALVAETFGSQAKLIVRLGEVMTGQTGGKSTELPFARVVRGTDYDSSYAQRYYKRADELKNVVKGLELVQKRGTEAEVDAFMEKHQSDLAEAQKFFGTGKGKSRTRGYQDYLNDLSKQEKAIRSAKDWDQKDRRAALEEIASQRSDLQRGAFGE